MVAIYRYQVEIPVVDRLTLVGLGTLEAATEDQVDHIVIAGVHMGSKAVVLVELAEVVPSVVEGAAGIVAARLELEHIGYLEGGRLQQVADCKEKHLVEWMVGWESGCSAAVLSGVQEVRT
jgi:hypothetical protein